MGEQESQQAGASLIGNVVNLAGLLEYQDDAIVSRTLIDKPKGTVTLFAFGEGQSLSEHTAPFDAMVCVLAGRAEIRIDGEAHQVAAGDMIIMPADHPHAVAAPQRFKMLLVMVRA
jgi:quercetin dioxygenase-like cupin family protein